MINGQNFFDQTLINKIITYDNIRKIENCQGDDYTSGCLLDYSYFKNYYEKIAIDLRKQQTLDGYPKAIQRISFIGNLQQQATIFLFIEEAKEIVLDFSRQTVKVF